MPALLWYRSVACVAALLAPSFALASGAPPGAPLYPLTARLRFSDETRSACLVHRGEMLVGPSNPDCRAAVGARLEEAFRAALGRMFPPAPRDGEADLQVEVTISGADIDAVMLGHRVVLRTRVALIMKSGERIDLEPSGGADFLERDERAIPEATARAAEEAAREFERTFSESPKVARWFDARGLGTMLAPPLRGDWLAFADVGGGGVVGGGDGATGGLVVHLGVSAPWVVLQAVASRWSPTFDTAPLAWGGQIQTAAGLGTTGLGLEAGAVYRWNGSSELRGGAGAHVLWGDASVASAVGTTPVFRGAAPSFSRVVPAVFAAAQTAIWPTRRGIRLRLGAEIRRYLFTTVAFPELSRRIPLADTYVGIYAGYELSWPTAAAAGRLP